jgi:hypothetical protein
MQLFPATETNPEVLGDLAAPPAVAKILRRSCYDCHSNETRWRWYSRIAPISWVIASHVNAARQQLNFSEWATYYPQTRVRKLEWMGRALQTEQMPPTAYLLFHPDARLSPDERAELERWIAASLNQPGS